MGKFVEVEFCRGCGSDLENGDCDNCDTPISRGEAITLLTELLGNAECIMSREKMAKSRRALALLAA